MCIRKRDFFHLVPTLCLGTELVFETLFHRAFPAMGDAVAAVCDRRGDALGLQATRCAAGSTVATTELSLDTPSK